MRTVFLDANILLDFYRFGQDDLHEMEKLVALIDEEEIVLLSNQQLLDEVARNREKVIVQSIREMRSTNFDLKAPKFCEGKQELIDVLDGLRSVKKAMGKLLASVDKQVQKETLPADILIKKFAAKSKQLPINNKVLESAELRLKLGNPPGKKNSIGDAVHWETLIRHKGSVFLDLVSRDGDFASEAEPNRISKFLEADWKSEVAKFGEVRLFKSLTDFFAKRFPDIKLSEEAVKNELIDQLAASPTFTSTHGTVSQLAEFESFTNSQTTKLFSALVNNNQVAWIGTDPDVRAFFLSLKSKAYWIPSHLHEDAATSLGIEEEDFFFPF